MALTKITSRILDSSGVTILGTISTGVWQGTAINQTYLVGQSGTNTGDETLARINALDITELGTISSGVWNGTAINQTYLVGQSGTNTGDETLARINALDITELGTVSSGVWNGTVIASAYLDADTAHLSTTQTFTGAKTFSSNVGIGTTPSNWKSTWKALNIGQSVGLFSQDNNTTGLSSNVIFDGSNWTNKNIGATAFYQQSEGAHYFYGNGSSTDAAGTTFSPTTRLTISSGGEAFLSSTLGLTIGQSSASGTRTRLIYDGVYSYSTALYINAVSSQPIYFKTSNTTRLTISSTGAATFSGNHIQGSDTLRLLAPSTILYLDANTDIAFRTSSTSEKMRLSQGGNFGIGDSAFNYYANRLVVKAPDEDGVTFLSGSGEKFWLCFADGTVNHTQELAGYISFDHGTNKMSIGGNAGYDHITIANGGETNITALNNSDTLTINNSGTYGGTIAFAQSTTNIGYVGSIRALEGNTSGDNGIGMFSRDRISFYTDSSTPDVTISSAGHLLVHATSTGARGVTIYGNGANGFYIRSTGTCGYMITNDGTNGVTSGNFITFYNNNAGVGSIVLNGASNTQYNTGSDYRLKEDLRDFNGLDLLVKIKMYDFAWKLDGWRNYGVMAHELDEVLPQAVTGEKDAVNDKGEIEVQGVDYSKIVPVLVKAIQEQQTIIEDLKSRIETLEG